MSSDDTETDYSVTGSMFLGVAKDIPIYVSPTNDSVGFAIQGYGWSENVWDFLSKNIYHFYEYATTGTFQPIALADEVYMLSWEFRGINDTASAQLSINWSQAYAVSEKTDISGNISDPALDFGTFRGIGMTSGFWARRDTDTSLDAYFVGLNRTVIMQGPMFETFFPEMVTEGYAYDDSFTPDWNHTYHSSTSYAVETPNENYFAYPSGPNTTIRLGAGPVYPAVWTQNTNTTFVMYQPMFRTEDGARWVNSNSPSMYLYRGSSLAGVYGLSELGARYGAKRTTNLSSSGTYYAVISGMRPMSTVCNWSNMEIGRASCRERV
jgi:hypothetical protein